MLTPFLNKYMKIPHFFILFIAFAVNVFAKTDKYRVIWNSSPETCVTIGWCKIDGLGAKVHYGEADVVNKENDYPLQKEVNRKTFHLELKSRFVRLEGLKPDTVYAFIVKDSNSESKRFTFKTAIADPGKFSFVAGGDSRNNRGARQNANRAVSKIRPMFVCFGGDMISTPSTKNWSEWLDDWQLTTGKDGRMVPIIAARGNHEGAWDVHRLFDTPRPEDYYALDFGKKFMRVYTLNSCIVRAGAQGEWLNKDLSENKDVKWKVAHYHHPFRPHHKGKREQDAQYKAWANDFYKYGMNLVIECDSHVVKRTWPVRPSNDPGNDQGFIRDDKNGITFIGEGCWGAPLRSNDDDKKWTRASASFNQVNWICVTPEKLFVRSIQVDNIAKAKSIDPSKPFELPEGMETWKPETGEVVDVFPRKTSKTENP